jgi:hypothetical protein
MALTLYRRHRKECEANYPEDFCSGEFEEGRRGWKKCACIIHVSGTLGGKSSRKQLRRSARIDHFRSPKVTHTKNTICPWARKMASDIIHAEGVRFAVPSSAPPGA